MSQPAYGSPPSSTADTSASLLHEPPGPASAPPLSAFRPSGSSSLFEPTGPPPTSGHAPLAAYDGPVTASERNWGTAAHLSAFVAAFFALGFLGPLLVMVTEGSRSRFVRAHAVEALNFNLSVLVYLLLGAVLMVLLVGFLLVPAIGIMYLVATALGATAANRGDGFRYPLTIRFVR